MPESPASQPPENALTFTFPGSEAQANALNRDLAEWINDTDQLGGRAGVRTAPPAPGELGDVAVAVDIVNASTAVIAAVTNAFFLWLQQRRSAYRRIEFEVVRPDGTRISGSVDDESQLPAVMAQLSGFVAAPPGAGE
ncbi:effector-associated constant component EACC1 [Streptomyces sp. NPDC047990]|uniref:effector-associated constant component EACC1 n=1 Tax=Streptomyces sp. NPDC047990 TaxID=3365496 RepID=UPI00371681FD